MISHAPAINNHSSLLRAKSLYPELIRIIVGKEFATNVMFNQVLYREFFNSPFNLINIYRKNNILHYFDHQNRVRNYHIQFLTSRLITVRGRVTPSDLISFFDWYQLLWFILWFLRRFVPNGQNSMIWTSLLLLKSFSTFIFRY